MQFISINTKLDEKYFVSNEAFQDGIEIAFKDVKLSKLISATIKINQASNEINVSLSVSLKSTSSKLADVFAEIENKINETSQNLINAKLSNLTIAVEGAINA